MLPAAVVSARRPPQVQLAAWGPGWDGRPRAPGLDVRVVQVEGGPLHRSARGPGPVIHNLVGQPCKLQLASRWDPPSVRSASAPTPIQISISKPLTSRLRVPDPAAPDAVTPSRISAGPGAARGWPRR